MVKQLLLMSVGPVQDFIATARTCQDLWFGSRLLSDLSETVARCAESETGSPALIFPADLTHERPAVANKVLIEVDEGSAESVAQACEEALGERFAEIGERTLSKVRREHLLEDVARSQLIGLREFDWTAVEISGSYEDARLAAESWLAATKNARPWSQPAWPTATSGGEGIPKCSICGARESVLREDAFDLAADELWRGYRAGEGERLCGVDLVKRWGVDPSVGDALFGDRRPVFHSTSHVASAPLLARIDDSAPAAVGRYLGELEVLGLDIDLLRIRVPGASHVELGDPLRGDRSLRVPLAAALDAPARRGIDGRIFYEGQLRAMLREERTEIAPPFEEGDVEKARQALAAVLGELEVTEPFPYYAFLLADGDKMGQAIETMGEADRHRALSARLEVFSRTTRDIFAGHQGSLIYAGGDDVLGLVPVHTALQCATELKDRFETELAPVFEAGEERPTLSVGLAFVHHLEPMTRARALARRAEDLAKRGPDGTPARAQRNALGIVYSPRSGGEISWRSQWGEGDRLCRGLWAWARRYLDGSLPHGAPFELENALAPLRLGDSSETDDAVVRGLARRVLGRRRDAGDAPIDTTAFEDRIDDLAAIQSLISELLVARLMARAYAQAWGPLETDEEDGE